MNLKPYILNGACVSYPMDLKFAAVVFLYSELHQCVLSEALFIRCVVAMCYDFLVLVLSIVGLSRQPSKSLLKERLRTQGLLYFAVVTVTCIPPTVWALHATSRVTNTHRYLQVLTLCFYRGRKIFSSLFPITQLLPEIVGICAVLGKSVVCRCVFMTMLTRSC